MRARSAILSVMGDLSPIDSTRSGLRAACQIRQFHSYESLVRLQSRGQQCDGCQRGGGCLVTRQRHLTQRIVWSFLATLILTCVFGSQAVAQDSGPAEQRTSQSSKGIDYLFNYLNMAGTKKAADFQPLTQKGRTHLYLKTMINPLGYLKAAFSAGIDQWNDKPEEWEQGASGYGKRYANILGQYSIQRTVTFGLDSALHEDNRYFNSGKKGIWSRTAYGLASGILARHDDGSRHVSISQIGGLAAGAFLSRFWQPPSQHSAGDGAVSFGITMSSNMGFGVVKEFLPDIGRKIARKKTGPSRSPQNTVSATIK
jgi:hypothetical protein